MAAVETSTGVGARVLRKEDRKLLTGQGRFVDDIKLPGMLHMAVVRSPHAHARINAIDTSAARAVPGVVAVYTAADLEFAAGVPCASNPTGQVRQPERPHIARDRVRHVGEPVAVVVAEQRYAARDGADLVSVDYDPIPAVIGVDAAMATDAPRVHEEYPDNTCVVITNKTAGADAAFAAADVVVKQRIHNQRTVPGSIEPRGTVAHWVQASDELTVWSSTQIPHFLRTFLAICCNVSEAKVRVIAPDVGGGFGGKLNCYAEEFITAAVSHKLGVPIKWIEDRSEAMLATIHGRAQDAVMELAATREGRVLAMRVNYLQDVGSYLQLLTPSIAHLTLFVAPGCYDIPEMDITVTEVFTNTTPTDACRGAGRPEATHAIERIMDILAGEVGKSREDIRRINFVKQFPHNSPTGIVYDSGNYEGTLDRALEIVGDAEAKRADARSRGRRFGRGFSTYMEICGLAPSAVTHAIGLTPGGWESATVRVHPTGKATVITGTSPHGQGHATSWSQIIETELGIPFADVEVIHGDTAFAPYGLGTYGSRSLAVGGTAVQRAATQIREKAAKVAAHMMEAAADDVEFDGGSFSVKGSPDRTKSIQEVAFTAWQAYDMPEGVTPGLDETVFFDPPNFTFPFGCHVCEVEVDEATGRVEIVRYLAVDDCGNVVNPMIVDGQVHGGVAHSIAQALYEQVVYDDSGQCLTTTFVDYLIPSAAEIPAIETERTVTPSPTNPMGVKGIGEAGTIAATAAVVGAVCDALGARDLDMPLLPETVWRAMQEGGRS